MEPSVILHTSHGDFTFPLNKRLDVIMIDPESLGISLAILDLVEDIVRDYTGDATFIGFRSIKVEDLMKLLPNTLQPNLG